MATFCQAFAAAMAVPGPDWFDSLKIAGAAFVVCIAKAIASTRVGDSRSASMVG